MEQLLNKKIDIYCSHLLTNRYNYRESHIHKIHNLMDNIINGTNNIVNLCEIIDNHCYCISNLNLTHEICEQLQFLQECLNIYTFIKFHHDDLHLYLIDYEGMGRVTHSENPVLVGAFIPIDRTNSKITFKSLSHDDRCDEMEYLFYHIIEHNNINLVLTRFHNNTNVYYGPYGSYRLIKLIWDLYNLPKDDLKIQNNKINDYGFYFNLMDYIDNKLYDNELFNEINDKLTRHYKCVIKHNKQRIIIKIKNLIKLIHMLINNMIAPELIFIMFLYMS